MVVIRLRLNIVFFRPIGYLFMLNEFLSFMFLRSRLADLQLRLKYNVCVRRQVQLYMSAGNLDEQMDEVLDTGTANTIEGCFLICLVESRW